jgi:hypothetical protein
VGEKFRSRGSLPYLSDQPGSSLLEPTSQPSTMPSQFVPGRSRFPTPNSSTPPGFEFSVDPTEALLKSLFQNLTNPRGFAQTVVDAEARRQLAAASRAGDPKETASALWRAIPGLPLVVSRDAFVKFFVGQGADAKNAVSGLAGSAAPAPTEP